MSALPTLLAKHIHITERETAHVWPDGRTDDGKWEDCAWVSLIEFIRLAYRPDLPATHAFMESIRARIDSPLGGTNPSQLIAGAKTIGATGPGTAGIVLKGYSASALWAAMKPGTVILANGSMGAFPAGHTLRRWDPSFAGGHSVMAARVDSLDRVWWCDPLAPKNLSTGPFVGQWVTKADFLKFVTKLNSTSFVAPIPDPIPAPAPAPTPAPVPAPVPVTYTQAQLDGIVAGRVTAQKSADAAILTAAVAAETTRATSAERSRIRSILGI